MSETIEASADLAPMRAARPLGTGHHRSRCPHRRGGVVHRCAGAQLRPPLWRITEELDMSPGHRRMDGLRSGSAPVLNTHRSSDARDVVGRVIAARLEGGAATPPCNSPPPPMSSRSGSASPTARCAASASAIGCIATSRSPIRATAPFTVRWIGSPTKSPSCRSRRPACAARATRALPSRPRNQFCRLCPHPRRTPCPRPFLRRRPPTRPWHPFRSRSSPRPCPPTPRPRPRQCLPNAPARRERNIPRDTANLAERHLRFSTNSSSAERIQFPKRTPPGGPIR